MKEFAVSCKGRQAGFTLLELLVVLLILGVLTALGLNNFFKSQIKARDAQRKSDLEQIAKSLELYYNDRGYYPIDDGDGHIQLAYSDGAGGTTYETLSWGDKFNDPNQEATIYMAKLPLDPYEGRRYYYRALHRTFVGGSQTYDTHAVNPDNEAEAYRLYGFLENTADSRVVEGGIDDTNCSVGTPVLCNFYITSTNIDLN